MTNFQFWLLIGTLVSIRYQLTGRESDYYLASAIGCLAFTCLAWSLLFPVQP